MMPLLMHINSSKLQGGKSHGIKFDGYALQKQYHRGYVRANEQRLKA